MARKRVLHGWNPDRPDFRDHRFDRKSAEWLAEVVDLRASGFEPPVYDQGQLGSCTGNGCGACFEFALRKQGRPGFTPSRLFIYYNERVIERTVKQDAGAQIRDGVKVLVKYGAPSEESWPYMVSKFALRPPRKVFTEAAKFQVARYERVDNSKAADIQHALSMGFPVVFGCTLYESFESAAVARSGHVPMPRMTEKSIGGHCMVIVGYRPGYWIVRNSWGPGWGDKGYCYVPTAYLCNTDLADDFWIVEAVEQ